ncbi:tRNA epoxyqueuosine(34) reductase QueG [Psychrobacillus sp. AK 1817]|uniref:tRNA epoxyqueuosine(34) reductase QueG n=1 Tax=Psychrobacillus sp. AK 1817 TaxID=2303505 RepID=UPI0012454285|nr:tRNA epoxyqueuosine(34) reductase QueG [Psychrobacillus sp. AK 1817]QEY22268.1 tRNA epoxyqueuosine(34) reductase QueG [Psychrobacillus sp. AK 1817]
MNINQFQQNLIEYAATIGIDKIGFTTVSPFHELKNRLIRQQELGYASGFEEPDLDKRTHPELLLEEAQSIISIAIAYPSKMKNAPQSVKGARRGIFARASWGIDYHTVLREKLAQLELYILTHIPDARLRSMVDTGELSDRAVAERSGIGWSAKNCSIITPEFGSYVYLGEMISSIPFAPSEQMEDQCGDCSLCLEVCPTGALIEGGQLNAQRCIAFITQTKTMVPDEFRAKIGNRIYGCDTCQTVCPKNKGKANLHQEAFKPDPELVKPLLLPLLSMSNRTFKETYGHMSGSWRGKNPIQRNAIIALAHFKEEAAVPTLIELMLHDARPVIRGTAAWAIGKINTEEGLLALKKAEKTEQEEQVIEEIRKGLAFYTIQN